MNYKFNIGDEVVCLKPFDGNQKVLNQKGTIIYMQNRVENGVSINQYGIDFHKNISGHNCSGRIKKWGNGWYINEDCLELSKGNLEVDLL